MAYLLDTNVVIDYLNASLTLAGMDFLSTVVDNEPVVSVITKIESLGFNFKFSDEQSAIESFVDGCNVLYINNDIVIETIAIRKSKKIKLPDAIIASTALVYGLVLLSCNTADFKSIDGLKIIDPRNL